MKKSKIISALVMVSITIMVFILPSFAFPETIPQITLTGGALSVNDTVLLSKAVSNQIKFNKSTGLTQSTIEPLFITAKDIGGDQWYYYIYLSEKTANVSDDPVEWGVGGANITINANYAYKCGYNFGNNGGIGLWNYKASTDNKIKLDASEYIVYLYKGIGIGISEKFNYGNYANIPAVYNWINAMKAFDGNISPEAIQNAEDLGYAKGFDDGYIDGINQGTANRESYWKDRVPILEQEAKEEGYNKGYAKAVLDLGADKVTAVELNIPAIITSIPSAAKSIINNIFGFELFGINIAGLLSVAIIIGIVSFMISKLIKK